MLKCKKIFKLAKQLKVVGAVSSNTADDLVSSTKKTMVDISPLPNPEETNELC